MGKIRLGPKNHLNSKSASFERTTINTTTMSQTRDYRNANDDALVESANDSEGTVDAKHEERKRRRHEQKEREAREKAEREEVERRVVEARKNAARDEKGKGKVSIIPT